MLSTVAKLWDLNGFCAPVVLYAKLLIQALWIAHIGWDDSPSEHICIEWKTFINELPLLHNFQIPRFFGITSDTHRVFLLGVLQQQLSCKGANRHCRRCLSGEDNCWRKGRRGALDASRGTVSAVYSPLR
ncbi:unnamed protein product, partial [Brenthis ino]